MVTESSIRIKSYNTKSGEVHNHKTAEYTCNIGESGIYVVLELSAGNKQWVDPDFGNSDL